MTFIDTYISHPDATSLEAFAGSFVNYMRPRAGIAAVAADDTTIPPTEAQPAKGDPALFYTCVRATFDITPLIVAPFAVADVETGAAVCGVWA